MPDFRKLPLRFDTMRYCPGCGHPLQTRDVETETRPRLVCDRCSSIVYPGYELVAGALTEMDGRALLMRRDLEPRRGAWTFPGGYVELDETPQEAAVRETLEEVRLEIALTGLLGVYSNQESGTAVVVFRARRVGGEAAPGHECQEVRLFAPREVPWDELAFPTVEAALRDWSRGFDRAGLP